MYAYQKQKTEPRRLHVISSNNNKQILNRRYQKTKKKNTAIELIRSFVSITFLLLFAYYIFPTAYNNLIKQVFYPNKIHFNMAYPSNLAMKDTKNVCDVDLYSLANPITKYINNDLFKNRLLLTPTIQKTHSEVTTMYQSSEIGALKYQLTSLMKEYPSIKPSIYVWEYENGKYVSNKSKKI